MKDDVYIPFLRRWWWLIALGVVVSVFVTSNVLSQQSPIYGATATVQIGSVLQNTNPDQGQINQVIDHLAPLYVEMAKRDPILSDAIAALGIPMGSEDLQSQLLVNHIFRSPLIDITVVDHDPARAAALANEVARQLILHSPDPSPQDQERYEFIQGQLEDLQQKITDGQAEVEETQERIAEMTSASDIQEARQGLEVLEAQLQTWQQSFARLVTTAEPSDTNLLTLASTAHTPTTPVPRSSNLYYGLALMIGAGLSTVLGMTLDLMNRSVKNVDGLEGLHSGIPVLTIPRFKTPPGRRPIMSVQPDSKAASAYRLLRNTLQAGLLTDNGVTIAVVSTKVAEGKTTTATNLAVALASSGRSVILVDANLHNPEADELFSLKPHPGLSELVAGAQRARDTLQSSQHPNLKIITAGRVPPDFADVLSRNPVAELLKSLSRMADYVVVDTPAIQEEREALLLVNQVDVVLAVVESGRAQRDDFQHMLDLLHVAGANLVAVVLNKANAPLMNLERLPWSPEARTHRRAERRRRAHADGPAALES